MGRGRKRRGKEAPRETDAAIGARGGDGLDYCSHHGKRKKVVDWGDILDLLTELNHGWDSKEEKNQG